MKTLKEILNEQTKQLKEVKFYRFHLFTNQDDKKRNVGMAYLMEGHNSYTIRLWTLLEDKFYLLPSKVDSSKFSILTREASRSPNHKNKYFWNVIGNAQANVSKGVVELNFDLFEKKIYMSIHPEDSEASDGKLIPEGILPAA